MNIATWLYQTALCWPDRPAVFDGNTLRHTYGTLLGAVCSTAHTLQSVYGVAPGDRVAIFAKNTPEILEIFHACWWIGAAVVPINCKLHPNEAQWIVENSGACVAFTDTGTVFPTNPALREVSVHAPYTQDRAVSAPAETQDDALAWLFYTSGTTGKPKGVMLSHDNLRHMTLCYALDVDAPRADDHMLYAAPMSHGAGLYMFSQIRAGGAHLIPASRGFDCGEIIDLATQRGNLVFFAAPTMVKRLVAAARSSGFTGEGIRTIIYGGGPMYASDIDQALETLGDRFVQIYGQGETPMTISALPRALVSDTTHPRWRSRRASVGYAQSCVTLAIMDPNDQPLAAGQTGEICVKGPTVMLGYWNDPRATAETLRQGWLHTGDLGHLDQDGFLTLTDRSKDVIISGGTNIYPREVEEALLCHPAVFEVAVIGEPEPDWGEQVIAYVTLDPAQTATAQDLDQWCRDHIAAFKRPKRYEFLTELPKNGYGKILKTELRAKVQTP